MRGLAQLLSTARKVIVCYCCFVATLFSVAVFSTLTISYVPLGKRDDLENIPLVCGALVQTAHPLDLKHKSEGVPNFTTVQSGTLAFPVLCGCSSCCEPSTHGGDYCCVYAPALRFRLFDRWRNIARQNL